MTRCGTCGHRFRPHPGERFADRLDWLLPHRRTNENAKGWCRRRPAGYHADEAVQ